MIWSLHAAAPFDRMADDLSQASVSGVFKMKLRIQLCSIFYYSSQFEGDDQDDVLIECLTSITTTTSSGKLR